MQLFKNSFIVFCFLALFCTIGCQSKKSSPPELVDINLLRGDIIMCGGNQFGDVSFSLSCSYETREDFNLGISLLHSFENYEAEKAFVKVIDKDPDCTMAYWAIAMSRISPNWGPKREVFDDTRKLLKIAESLPKTTREKDYIDAMGAYYYSDWETDHRTRARKAEKKMEEIYLKYKDDTEAAIFYALILYTTTDPEDKKYTNQLKAGKILESIFPDQPNHPGIAHYIIHNYDNPELAHLALETARIYADIAPASAHAQHMPSHIFTRLGLWDESINTNLNSQSSAQCYAESAGLDGHWSGEVHPIGYLLYAYLQKGDNVKANDLYEYLKTIYKMPSDVGTIAYHFAAAPVRIALENKQWNKAMNVSVHPSTVQWNLFPWQKSLQSFARVLGAVHTGNLKRAEKELDSLQSFRQELLAMDDQYKANQVMIQIKAAQAWIHYAKGNNEEAIALMTESADMEDKTQKHAVTPGEVLPARELLGDMLLDMNKPAQALEAYELNLKRHPNRFNGIYGAAVSAKKLGEQEQATMYFEELLKLVDGVDSDRAELEEAREFVRQKES